MLDMHKVVGSIPIAPTRKKPGLSTWLFSMMFAYGKMMLASPNYVDTLMMYDKNFASELRHNDGKHRIIANRVNNIIFERSECIISPQAMLH